MKTALIAMAATALWLSGCASTEESQTPTAEPAAAESAPSITHPELRAALLELRDRDQAARKRMLAVIADAERNPDGSFKLEPSQIAIMQDVQAIDAESTVFLKATVERHGWPSIDMVGEDGAGAAWLLAQHADRDPEFQERVLELMAPMVAEGQARGRDYAYLTDRVRRAKGEPQLYGTQFVDDDEGVLRPAPIEDPDRVDERRSAVGLPPLAVYAERMAESYDQPVSPEPMPATPETP